MVMLLSMLTLITIIISVVTTSVLMATTTTDQKPRESTCHANCPATKGGDVSRTVLDDQDADGDDQDAHGDDDDG